MQRLGSLHNLSFQVNNSIKHTCYAQDILGNTEMSLYNAALRMYMLYRTETYIQAYIQAQIRVWSFISFVILSEKKNHGLVLFVLFSR